jgi:hypothetical protein
MTHSWILLAFYCVRTIISYFLDGKSSMQVDEDVNAASYPKNHQEEAKHPCNHVQSIEPRSSMQVDHPQETFDAPPTNPKSDSIDPSATDIGNPPTSSLSAATPAPAPVVDPSIRNLPLSNNSESGSDVEQLGWLVHRSDWSISSLQIFRISTLRFAAGTIVMKVVIFLQRRCSYKNKKLLEKVNRSLLPLPKVFEVGLK